jgi:hypothetical protein
LTIDAFAWVRWNFRADVPAFASDVVRAHAGICRALVQKPVTTRRVGATNGYRNQYAVHDYEENGAGETGPSIHGWSPADVAR